VCRNKRDAHGCLISHKFDVRGKSAGCLIACLFFLAPAIASFLPDLRSVLDCLIIARNWVAPNGHLEVSTSKLNNFLGIMAHYAIKLSTQGQPSSPSPASEQSSQPASQPASRLAAASQSAGQSASQPAASQASQRAGISSLLQRRSLICKLPHRLPRRQGN